MIVYDNIIFALQKVGGISVVWAELLQRAIKDNLPTRILDYSSDNLLRNSFTIPENLIINNSIHHLPIVLQRYINPKLSNTPFIFHSSYYRTVSQPKAINITTVHDFIYEHFRTGIQRKIHSWQKTKAILNSDKIICVSQNTKNDLLKLIPIIDEQKVVVVYNGVSKDFFPIKNLKCVQSRVVIPFQPHEYVLYVGDRTSDYKNFKMVLDACKMSKFPLIMVGGGALSSCEIEHMNRELGFNAYFQVSNLSNQDLNFIYNQAAFLLYPSSYEGFGIPIIEAQRAGCPVICSNQSSIPEIAGNAAYIIDDIDGEKISEILLATKSQHLNIAEIIQQGFTNSKRFSWDKCYEDTRKVYEEIHYNYFDT